MDVKNVFLNGDLKVNVISQPEGFVLKGQENKVYKFFKSLYGLNQAPRVSYEKLTENLLNIILKHYDLHDETLFIKKFEKIVVYIVVYVSDILMIGNNENYITSIKKEPKKCFEMEILGYVHYYLDIEVIQHMKFIFLSHKCIGYMMNRIRMAK